LPVVHVPQSLVVGVEKSSATLQVPKPTQEFSPEEVVLVDGPSVGIEMLYET